MNHLFQLKRIRGYEPIVTRSSADPYSYFDFGILKLGGEQAFEFNTGEDEVVLTVLYGSIAVKIGDKTIPPVGVRKSVFEGKPSAIYVPANHTYSVKSLQGEETEVAISSAICLADSQPSTVNPDDLESFWRGKDNWSRLVTMVNVPSTNLIVGEVFNPAGNWSGTPPHRHDFNINGQETIQEEIYHYRFSKPGGFGIMRLYEETGMEQLYTFYDGDTVRMPTGYHQVVAGPGYELWYIFVLAGPQKDNIVFYDPNEDWLLKEQ